MSWVRIFEEDKREERNEPKAREDWFARRVDRLRDQSVVAAFHGVIRKAQRLGGVLVIADPVGRIQSPRRHNT